jgi:hypothetical protein
MSLQNVDSYVRSPREENESFWTDGKVQRLRELVAVGVRGVELLDHLGCNRSQLYSKLGRLKIKLGLKQPALQQSTRRKAARNSFSFNPQTFGGALPPGLMELRCEPSDAAVRLIDIDAGRCKWPISGAGLDLMACGERAQDCDPYCARHHRIAYRGRTSP